MILSMSKRFMMLKLTVLLWRIAAQPCPGLATVLPLLLICIVPVALAAPATPQEDAFVTRLAQIIELRHPGRYILNTPDIYKSVPLARKYCWMREQGASAAVMQDYTIALLRSSPQQSEDSQLYIQDIFDTTKEVCP